MKLEAIQRPPNALLIGESGRGKTRFLGSLAQLVPTVLVTADRRGLDTLGHLSDLQLEVELVEDWVDPWALLEKLRGYTKSHKALAIDDFGAQQSVIERKIKMQPFGQVEERMRSDERDKTTRSALLRGQRKLAQPQWGEMATALDSFLFEALALPFGLVVVTVLEDVRRHPRTGEDQVYPALDGKMREELAARFSFVGNLFLADGDGKTHWAMSCRPHPRLPNKTRYGTPRTWIDPDATKLMAHINRREEIAETPLERQIGAGEIKEAK